MSAKKEFVVGVTGASGAPYARRLLEVLANGADVHLIVTDQARGIAAREGVTYDDLDVTRHRNDDLAAAIASGSHRIDGMAIVPCSTKTLASIAPGSRPRSWPGPRTSPSRSGDPSSCSCGRCRSRGSISRTCWPLTRPARP